LKKKFRPTHFYAVPTLIAAAVDLSLPSVDWLGLVLYLATGMVYITILT